MTGLRYDVNTDRFVLFISYRKIGNLMLIVRASFGSMNIAIFKVKVWWQDATLFIFIFHFL